MGRECLQGCLWQESVSRAHRRYDGKGNTCMGWNKHPNTLHKYSFPFLLHIHCHHLYSSHYSKSAKQTQIFLSSVWDWFPWERPILYFVKMNENLWEAHNSCFCDICKVTEMLPWKMRRKLKTNMKNREVLIPLSIFI